MEEKTVVNKYKLIFQINLSRIGTFMVGGYDNKLLNTSYVPSVDKELVIKHLNQNLQYIMYHALSEQGTLSAFRIDAKESRIIAVISVKPHMKKKDITQSIKIYFDDEWYASSELSTITADKDAYFTLNILFISIEKHEL